MARNRTSGMVVVGVGMVFLVVAGGVAWRMIGGSPDDVEVLPSVSRGAAAEVGNTAADRPGETMQALAADQESLRSRMQGISDTVATGIDALTEQVGLLGQDLTALRSEQESMAEDDAADTRIDRLRVEMLDSMQTMLDEFERRTGADYPVAGGAQDRGVPGQDGFLWYSAGSPEPVGGAPGTALAALQDRFSLPGTGGTDPFAPGGTDDLPLPPLPVYTIPSDAVLAGSTSLTALIGRVPLGGQLVDPFPFRIITGRDNLLANGQILPELERAVWSGVATGDATLHCVSGEVTRVTFIFRDGTISTWPDADGGGGTDRGRLGWISDEQGYPCIPGRFVSNLHENIGKITSASFASSLARAWSEQQVTTTREGGAVTRSLTGDPGEYVLGQGIGGGIDEWARIIVERASETFDAVVVSPGQTVSIHVDGSIPVDWAPEGRRLRHVSVSSVSTTEAGKKPGGFD